MRIELYLLDRRIACAIFDSRGELLGRGDSTTEEGARYEAVIDWAARAAKADEELAAFTKRWCMHGGSGYRYTQASAFAAKAAGKALTHHFSGGRFDSPEAEHVARRLHFERFDKWPSADCWLHVCEWTTSPEAQAALKAFKAKFPDRKV